MELVCRCLHRRHRNQSWLHHFQTCRLCILYCPGLMYERAPRIKGCNPSTPAPNAGGNECSLGRWTSIPYCSNACIGTRSRRGCHRNIGASKFCHYARRCYAWISYLTKCHIPFLLAQNHWILIVCDQSWAEAGWGHCSVRGVWACTFSIRIRRVLQDKSSKHNIFASVVIKAMSKVCSKMLRSRALGHMYCSFLQSDLL